MPPSLAPTTSGTSQTVVIEPTTNPQQRSSGPNEGSKPAVTMESMQNKPPSDCCLVWCWRRVCAFFSAIGNCICSLFGKTSQKAPSPTTPTTSNQPTTTAPEPTPSPKPTEPTAATNTSPSTPQVKKKSLKEQSLLRPIYEPTKKIKKAIAQCEDSFCTPAQKGAQYYYSRHAFLSWECYQRIANDYAFFTPSGGNNASDMIKLEFLHALTDVRRAAADTDLAKSILAIDTQILREFSKFLIDCDSIKWDKAAREAALDSDDPVTAVHKFADQLMFTERSRKSFFKTTFPFAKSPSISKWIPERLANYAAQFEGQSVKYDRASLTDPTYGCFTDFQDYTLKEQLEFIYVLTQPERAGADQPHKDSIQQISKEALALFIDAMDATKKSKLAFNKKLLQAALEEDKPAMAVHQFLNELLLAYTKTGNVPKKMRLPPESLPAASTSNSTSASTSSTST